MVAADWRKPRDGKFIENIGTYDPNLDSAEVPGRRRPLVHWTKVGAKPSETVYELHKKAAKAAPPAKA